MVEPSEHRCEERLETRQATREKPYHFTDSGLPNVYLSGIRYFICAQCGKYAAEIPALKQLLGVIARAIIEREGRLTGAEIRFLRKRLGKKASEFAKIVGVTPEQVSRWENDGNPPEPSADKLIRLYYALLSGDRKLQRRLDKDMHQELERWLAELPSEKHLERIQAVRGRKKNWKVDLVGAEK